MKPEVGSEIRLTTAGNKLYQRGLPAIRIFNEAFVIEQPSAAL